MTKMKVEILDRRQFLITSGAATAMLAGLSSGAFADAAKAKKVLDSVLKGATAADGMVKVDLPEIAENGNTVPVKVSVESPMTADNYVKSVTLISEGNPEAEVASYHFTPASGKANVAARVRLARTQNIIGVAEMSDGKFYMSKSQVKVTIGGCGG